MTEKDKKLKTNQMMTIQIGDGQVLIGHKTEIGKLNDVLEIGNRYRAKKGLKNVNLEDWLRKESTWEFIIKVNVEHLKKSNLQIHDWRENSLFSDEIPNWEIPSLDFGETLKNFPKDIKGRILYSEILKSKEFQSVIKSQRGGKPENRGVWANLYILLDLATFLDVDLKYEMYDVFIHSNILTHRDNGGESFKKLNIAIDKYIPSESGNSEGRFIMIAKMLRKKLEITSTKGYNEKEHNSQIQQKRDEIEKNLIFALESKIVTSYEKLKVIITNLEINL